MFDKKKKSYIEISKEDFTVFIDNACIRAELESNSKEYIQGYIKGVQVALLDLLDYTENGYKGYRDDVSKLEERLRSYLNNEQPTNDSKGSC